MSLRKKLWWFGVKQSQIHDINKGYDVHELSTPYDKVDFMKWAKPLFALSGVVIVAGVIILAIFKLNLGLILHQVHVLTYKVTKIDTSTS